MIGDQEEVTASGWPKVTSAGWMVVTWQGEMKGGITASADSGGRSEIVTVPVRGWPSRKAVSAAARSAFGAHV